MLFDAICRAAEAACRAAEAACRAAEAACRAAEAACRAAEAACRAAEVASDAAEAAAGKFTLPQDTFPWGLPCGSPGRDSRPKAPPAPRVAVRLDPRYRAAVALNHAGEVPRAAHDVDVEPWVAARGRAVDRVVAAHERADVADVDQAHARVIGNPAPVSFRTSSGLLPEFFRTSSGLFPDFSGLFRTLPDFCGLAVDQVAERDVVRVPLPVPPVLDRVGVEVFHLAHRLPPLPVRGHERACDGWRDPRSPSNPSSTRFGSRLAPVPPAGVCALPAQHHPRPVLPLEVGVLPRRVVVPPPAGVALRVELGAADVHAQHLHPAVRPPRPRVVHPADLVDLRGAGLVPQRAGLCHSDQDSILCGAGLVPQRSVFNPLRSRSCATAIRIRSSAEPVLCHSDQDSILCGAGLVPQRSGFNHQPSLKLPNHRQITAPQGAVERRRGGGRAREGGEAGEPYQRQWKNDAGVVGGARGDHPVQRLVAIVVRRHADARHRRRVALHHPGEHGWMFPGMMVGCFPE
eukprot:gene6550-biopygen692